MERGGFTDEEGEEDHTIYEHDEGATTNVDDPGVGNEEPLQETDETERENIDERSVGLQKPSHRRSTRLTTLLSTSDNDTLDFIYYGKKRTSEA